MSNLCGRPIYQKGLKPAKSMPIRNASAQAECTLRIPGICTFDPSRSSGCHARFFNFAGAAQKVDDLFLIDGCDACHSILDQRSKWADAALGWDDVLRALMLSQQRRRASGLIVLRGEAA